MRAAVVRWHAQAVGAGVVQCGREGLPAASSPQRTRTSHGCMPWNPSYLYLYALEILRLLFSYPAAMKRAYYLSHLLLGSCLPIANTFAGPANYNLAGLAILSFSQVDIFASAFALSPSSAPSASQLWAAGLHSWLCRACLPAACCASFAGPVCALVYIIANHCLALVNTTTSTPPSNPCVRTCALVPAVAQAFPLWSMYYSMQSTVNLRCE